MNATPAQLKALHAMLHQQGLLRHKTEMIDGLTQGRTSSSKELTKQEAALLLQQLDKTAARKQDNTAMLRKLFAMCFEIGWIKETTTVLPDGSIRKGKDYSRVHGWVATYGYLKKPLNRYTHNELPKLISQFEIHIYSDYITKKH